jgi:hypothetical protein
LPGGVNLEQIIGSPSCSGSASISDYLGCVNAETYWPCTGSGPTWSCNVDVPSNPGLYGYFGCVDLNNDGDYDNTSEQSSKEYAMVSSTTTTCPCPDWCTPEVNCHCG